VAIEVTMPKFGLTMHEGTIQRFFKSPGESVKAGEPIFEVETEKVLYEVESPANGTLAVALCEEGATIECGLGVVVIAETSEDTASVAAKYASRAAQPVASNHVPQAAPAPTVTQPEGTAGGRRAVSPVARKLAAELGVNLDSLNGTGPGGRITKEDVERAAKSPAAPAPAQAAPAPAGQRTPMRGVRKLIAERMHQSLRATAQLTIASEVDVTPATELRARLTREFDFTYTDMLVHACARALLRHPRMSTKLDGADLVTASEINVGLAVALDEGLIVPVIRNADKKGLREIAVESRALAEKAHASRLKLEDVSGGTFTISNLGTYGVDAFTPILNHGETGILGVGRIVEKPAIYRGEITRRAMLTLSLTFDHRVIDGAPAAEFLQSVVEILNYGER